MSDTNEPNRDRAMEYFKRGGLKSRFDFILDDALQAARRLKGPYDIVFNDIDKHEYPETIEVAARLLRPGGIFITDDIIWSGRVMGGNRGDKYTRGIKRFTRELYADQRFFTTILPLRDGITMAVRQ